MSNQEASRAIGQWADPPRRQQTAPPELVAFVVKNGTPVVMTFPDSDEGVRELGELVLDGVVLEIVRGARLQVRRKHAVAFEAGEYTRSHLWDMEAE